MEPSQELRDLLLRFYQAQTAGDFSFLEGVLSRQPGVVSIGTDPSEWWPNFDAIIQAAQLEAQQLGGGMRVMGADPQAYSEGSVGWVADRATFELPGGIKIPVRITAVFHKEDGAWRLVQTHSSVGVRNEDLMPH